MTTDDTIVAISSATGRAARMIVRLSGPDALTIATKFTRRTGRFSDQCVVEQHSLHFNGLTFNAFVYAFIAPRSYTGQHLIEFHLPGNPLLARMTLDACQHLGARLAEPGEFTARAYFNGRLDLTEAEGVMATIAAHGEAELSAARQLLAGELSRRLKPAMELLADTLALVEVGIDFVDEDVTFLSDEQIADRLAKIDAMLADIQASSSRLEKLSHEPRVVLVGKPNAGKSTLLNALVGHDRAVVSPIAGTTRDALTATVFLRRGSVMLTDVAGLEAGSDDEIERQMQSQAAAAIESADVVVWIEDCSSDPNDSTVQPDLIVHTKADLKPSPQRGVGLVRGETFTVDSAATSRANSIGEPAPLDDPRFSTHPSPLPSGAREPEAIRVSAVTGEGMFLLREALDRLAFGAQTPGATLSLTSRHLLAIESTRAAIARAGSLRELETIATELREALDSLGQIMGVIAPDELLGRVFSAFCIGK